MSAEEITRREETTLQIIRDVSFHGNVRDENYMRARYEEHNAEVEAAFPEGRRSTFSAGDGWEPLCAWLGVAVPDGPFPHTNSTADFQKIVARVKKADRERASPN